ncbi:hypothetical protein [Streptomyces sp. NPDC059604]|uniref:hypothetical protein n=1 Tax=Streptomyces sp. NPDC059604 TaxID=3346881 RepID=UPI0036A861D5
MSGEPKEMRAVWERTRELGQGLDEARNRLDTLEGQNLGDRLGVLEGQGLADRIEELSLVVKRLADKPESTPAAVWNWNAFTPDQQASAWDVLMEWVEVVFRARWPRSYKEMLGYMERPTSCWWQHPDMVESLTSLMMSHHWAYLDKEASPLRVAEWLGRWLPDAVRQGKHVLAECTSGHKPDLFAGKSLRADYEEVRKHVHMLRTGEIPNS